MWTRHCEAETKAMAQHMFAHYGRDGELLERSLIRPAPAPVLQSLSLTASSPALPAGRAAPKVRGQHDPSLVATTLGTRRWPGSYTLGHAHSRIGGAADSLRQRPPSPRAEAAMGWRAPESPGGHSRLASACQQSGAGSAAGRRADSARSAPASRISRASALSAASRVLLHREVERAVQGAVSEALSSPKGTP
mmetsp:Transcript_21850/g.44291  ORF Transcript_21850/g.44291 Transcript_21850/m.44291 type:complete len:193 (-) Transcript_21850:144-722(-)